MEPRARGIDSVFQVDVVREILSTLCKHRIAREDEGMRPKHFRRSDGRAGSVLGVLPSPEGELGTFDACPVTAGERS
jgi:hypothetical protein